MGLGRDWEGQCTVEGNERFLDCNSTEGAISRWHVYDGIDSESDMETLYR